MNKAKNQIIPISVGMPKGLARYLRVLAAKECKSRSQFIREKLEEVLELGTHGHEEEGLSDADSYNRSEQDE